MAHFFLAMFERLKPKLCRATQCRGMIHTHTHTHIHIHTTHHTPLPQQRVLSLSVLRHIQIPIFSSSLTLQTQKHTSEEEALKQQQPLSLFSHFQNSNLASKLSSLLFLRPFSLSYNIHTQHNTLETHRKRENGQESSVL